MPLNCTRRSDKAQRVDWPDSSWVGASYGISPYHTGHQPYSLNAPLAGLFTLYYLTGDPDAREAALGIADWLHKRNLGVGSGSARAVGWPLRSAMMAYENTYDPKHLEAGRRLAEFTLEMLVPRRQFFSERAATWQYRGGLTGMNSILAGGLIRYWRATGDERVGRACANIAYDFAYDWMMPTEPGVLVGADPLQQYRPHSVHYLQPLFWGYELTGDDVFLEKGAQVMRETLRISREESDRFALGFYWEMPDILYYYGLYRQRDSGK